MQSTDSGRCLAPSKCSVTTEPCGKGSILITFTVTVTAPRTTSQMGAFNSWECPHTRLFWVGFVG